MSTQSSTKDIGLRGVLVADTNISSIDGVKGQLSYRGYDIHDLAEYSTYEEVAYLLLYGNLPTASKLEQFSKELISQRELPQEIITSFQKIPKTSASMDVLQATVALLAGFDSELLDESKEANQRKATRLIAKTPTIIAAWYRVRNNLAVMTPDRTLSHAANFLYMLRGAQPDKETARDFDVCLTLHSEHSFNASTFAARVVASTRAHAYASVAAAVGALSGRLHGGANSRVMRNLMEIGDPAKVEDWVKTQFDRNKRIMGMGHAVYKTVDPRAVILRQMSERLAQKTGESKWYLMTKKIEEITEREFRKRKGRDIYPNVDLYSASVYYMMGISPDLYTSVFAASRIAGWAAHIIEEKFPESPVKPVLYRPLAEYIGNYCGPTSCKYVPVEKR
ncbi:MAG TPA: citrate/2-methylcitrate synthase [Candidatus Bathyarchaeia archaeon]|nr:citrate/2-methylcitrate synthase [Candidatus Bathyarchaeia archaeon]